MAPVQFQVVRSTLEPRFQFLRLKKRKGKPRWWFQLVSFDQECGQVFRENLISHIQRKLSSPLRFASNHLAEKNVPQNNWN